MKQHRWTGKPEVWLNEEKNIIILREGEYNFNSLNLNNPSKYLKYGVFKHQWTFDFYNGSAYLQKNGFKLMERVNVNPL